MTARELWEAVSLYGLDWRIRLILAALVALFLFLVWHVATT